MPLRPALARRRERVPRVPLWQLPKLASMLSDDLIGMAGLALRESEPIKRVPIGNFGLGWLRRIVRSRELVLVNSLEGVRELFRERRDHFEKGHEFTEDFPSLVGDQGLITMLGREHRERRKSVQPPFVPRSVPRFHDVMVRETERFLDAWGPRATTGEPFDAAPEMGRLSLRIIAHAMFEKRFAPAEEEAIRNALRVGNEYVCRKFLRVSSIQDRLPTRINRAMKKAQRTIDETVYGMIDEARAKGPENLGPANYLAALLRLDLPPRAVRDEIVTVFIAGQDTSANALLWTLFELARQPEMQRRFAKELDGHVDGAAPTLQEIESLPLLSAVWREGLRLHPPAFVVSRQANRDTTLCGYSVAKGTKVFISLHQYHRLERVWGPDAKRFDPDRWLDGRTDAIDDLTLSYLPYSFGAHRCLGEHFANLEGVSVLGALFKRYHVTLAPGRKVSHLTRINVSPRGGLWISLAPR